MTVTLTDEEIQAAVDRHLRETDPFRDLALLRTDQAAAKLAVTQAQFRTLAAKHGIPVIHLSLRNIRWRAVDIERLIELSTIPTGKRKPR